MYINRQYVEPVLDFCLARSQGSSVIMAPAPAQPAHGKDGHGGPAAATSQGLIKSFFAPLPPPPPGPGRPPKQTRPGGRPPATPAAAAESAATKRNASGNSGTHRATAARLRPRKNLASRRNRRARAAQAVRRTSAPHQRLPHGTRARPRANCRLNCRHADAPCATNALHENAHLPFPLHPQLICVVLFRLLLLY